MKIVGTAKHTKTSLSISSIQLPAVDVQPYVQPFMQSVTENMIQAADVLRSNIGPGIDALRASLSNLSPAVDVVKNLALKWKALIIMTVVGIIRLPRIMSSKVVIAGLNKMEKGWARRGTGGSFRRTIEVWAFAIRFIFKYVSFQRIKS
jgi:hypothetical protein